MKDRTIATGTDVVRIEVRNRVAVITLTRPDRRNALHDAMYAPTFAALDEFATASDVGCVVLTGEGTAFCAGGDVRDGRAPRSDGSAPTPADRVARLRSNADLSRRLHEHPKLTMAAVNGPAVGAGMALALACDLRIASAGARFIPGWIRLAFAGDFGGAWLLARLVGPAKALEILAGNTAVSADAALELGMVNRVASDEEFPAAWARWAEEIAAGPQAALRLTKMGIADAMRLDLATYLDVESQRQVDSTHDPDHREAVRAWMDGREPRFGPADESEPDQ